jgi:hypothetical protein
MNDLNEIGFYTLSDCRVRNSYESSQMKRCELIITEYYNSHCPYCRGMVENDSNKCALVLDDSVIAGDYHFPCVIYMREKGEPIGNVLKNMRKERSEWFKSHDCFKDNICRKNCLDVCIDYNNKYKELRNKGEN